MNEQTFMKLMQILPKSALSSAVGVATRLPAPAPVHRMAMKAFAKALGANAGNDLQPTENLVISSCLRGERRMDNISQPPFQVAGQWWQ